MTDSQIVTRLAACHSLKELYAVRALARDHIDACFAKGPNYPHEQLVKIASDGYFGRDGEGPKVIRQVHGWEHTEGSVYWVAAIKAVRNATGMGLKEAKDWCDKYRHEFK